MNTTSPKCGPVGTTSSYSNARKVVNNLISIIRYFLGQLSYITYSITGCGEGALGENSTPMKLQFEVSRASLIFQKGFQDAVSSQLRACIAFTSCTRSNIAKTKQTKIRKKRNN